MDLERLNEILLAVWNHQINVEQAAQDIANELEEYLEELAGHSDI